MVKIGRIATENWEMRTIKRWAIRKKDKFPCIEILLYRSRKKEQFYLYVIIGKEH